MECIALEDALKQMDELYKKDVARYGIDTPNLFEAERAKRALEAVPRFVDIVRPVRCKFCKYKKEIFTPDSQATGNGFKIYDCEKSPGGYLGDNGYCSQGRAK